MITCHIATLPDRVESLRQCVGAIYPQVDKVYVMLNGHTEVPSFLRELRNVQYEMCDNSLYGDAAKWLHVNDDNGIVFVLDDDLVVSPSYVKYMLYGLKNYGGAVSLHGKRYANRPITSFRRGYTTAFRCLNGVSVDQHVDVIGTGCLAYDNTNIKVDDSVLEHRNMADILFSRFCVRNKIWMWVLKHHAGTLLRYIKPQVTIWNTTGNDSLHTQILNSFLCPSE